MPTLLYLAGVPGDSTPGMRSKRVAAEAWAGRTAAAASRAAATGRRSIRSIQAGGTGRPDPRWSMDDHGVVPTTRDDAPSFDPELFAFLRELADHNERPWFQANKPRY